MTSVISDLFISTPEAADLKAEILSQRESKMCYFLVCIISSGENPERGGKAEGKNPLTCLGLCNSFSPSKNSLEKLEMPPSCTSDQCFYNQKYSWS